MAEFLVPLAWGVFAYLAGSITWGDIIARLYGVDIRAVGNRNPGAANVYRCVGPIQGIAVFLADVLTGFVVVLPASGLPAPEVTRLVASVMVLVGTAFSVFWGFRGGTGLAKAMGAAMAINPAGFFIGAPLGILIVWKFHNPGWGGGVVMGITALASALLYGDLAGLGNVLLLSALVFLRSRVQYRRTG